MKQIIFGLMLFCLCFYAGAQKIKKMEYFFDADPGVGKAKPFPVSAADTITLNTSIPINNLQQGLHNLYVRAKTDTGWGLTESFLFSIYDSALARSVTREEYFFDSDAGFGSNLSVAL
ncbi:MAG TPA: hypothetical protein PLA68_06160, partial [Panacibacter sp.]|nr:hypothetical protein [Panacibacter sp.]